MATSTGRPQPAGQATSKALSQQSHGVDRQGEGWTVHDGCLVHAVLAEKQGSDEGEVVFKEF